MGPPVVQRGVAWLAVVALLSVLAACGSGSLAQDAKNAASTATGAAKEQLAAATTTTTTATSTRPADTVTQSAKTVTQPARTQTITRTETTTVHSNTTTVKVSPATTTGKESSGGIPSWGWALIGAGAVLLVVAIFMIGRSRGSRARDETGPPGPSRPPDSSRPPRGPPEDPI
jgi:cobalamin biosynthesis Mg chelatase CobN